MSRIGEGKNMGRLQDKVAIVTGASSGIGRATYELFAREGATVVGIARRPGPLQEVTDAIVADGGTAIAEPIDLTDDAGVGAIIARTLSDLGRIDVLVNCAGVGYSYGEKHPEAMAAVHETEPEQWRHVLALNLDTYFHAIRHVVPAMLKAGRGSIVNVASMSGMTGLTSAHTYTAAKGAVINLTRSMAITYIEQGIRTNTVSPGLVATPMVASFIDTLEDRDVAVKFSPAARPGQPIEIAYANLFFASDESSYCNGSMLIVDGGTTARAVAE
ncbi:NAD(P)-dependent dehydrogenase, short-chain alcohol dehydrogenase family [Pseudonocardia thermophila]|uniref:NAD(P)-dependent dehydrogenase, short-chain alcohol dehydrogenase family n=1 Tax=Pseudonocardia thermophila TaxID=1848 RepID=A0A1M6WQN6_PSETH|nr:SDR family oxidoreductase [Pseudonocardia thermophila]SHK95835.1 NAD(P)-dependent dehydrogenase, short-chain alcohol dehydrogenase family [Pseudonocardia thermophila]